MTSLCEIKSKPLGSSHARAPCFKMLALAYALKRQPYALVFPQPVNQFSRNFRFLTALFKKLNFQNFLIFRLAISSREEGEISIHFFLQTKILATDISRTAANEFMIYRSNESKFNGEVPLRNLDLK
jgi:hypothetical protein